LNAIHFSSACLKSKVNLIVQCRGLGCFFSARKSLSRKKALYWAIAFLDVLALARDDL
jgi:hypothetical protein